MDTIEGEDKVSSEGHNSNHDHDFYCAEVGSDSFHEFLEILGEVQNLLGFKGFTAGLDTKLGQTGTQVCHTLWTQFEVTYHVSTFLPFTKTDVQQIQRKRHIGNGKGGKDGLILISIFPAN